MKVRTPTTRDVVHAADKVVAVVALAVSAPLFVAIAVAIRARSGGPVLVAETRVGRCGRIIRMFSFRTAAATGDCAPARAWSRPLNALPQLINVLRGEMSIVGPRAPRPEELSRLLRGRPGVIRVRRHAGAGKRRP